MKRTAVLFTSDFKCEREAKCLCLWFSDLCGSTTDLVQVSAACVMQ